MKWRLMSEKMSPNWEEEVLRVVKTKEVLNTSDWSIFDRQLVHKEDRPNLRFIDVEWLDEEPEDQDKLWEYVQGIIDDQLRLGYPEFILEQLKERYTISRK